MDAFRPFEILIKFFKVRSKTNQEIKRKSAKVMEKKNNTAKSSGLRTLLRVIFLMFSWDAAY
jgi:hypothetical protein